jgi:TetR/AcrR family transcriptional regulator, transcriptional repressor for nem operon
MSRSWARTQLTTVTDRSVVPSASDRLSAAGLHSEAMAEAQMSGALQTRQALLDAGAALAEVHGLAGVSVNMVVARTGVAKGTFYVHFKDRAAFVDAMHERFHARVQAAVEEAIAGLGPGAERIFRSAQAYFDVSLANRGVKALSLEARSDPTMQDSMAARRERLTAAGVADLKAMGWEDAEAAAQLLAAMTREISVLEFDAGRPLPASRRALKRFLGI